MLIGGFQKFSLSDYPGRISAILFTRGCNFRCPYCHNPELVDPDRYSELMDQEEILSFLESRASQLQGVVITGGEPTLQPDLPDLMKRIKRSGFLVKLDTNGSDPLMIGRLLAQGTIDFCAMDVKAPPASYERISRVQVDPDKILSSIALIRSSGIEHELRTTFVPSLLSLEEMAEIGNLAAGSPFIVQRYRRSKILDPGLLENAESSDAVEALRTFLTRKGVAFKLR
jgi:pyruvate formate lyase activating enzyme